MGTLYFFLLIVTKSAVFSRWADIKNVINHKRDFTIETIDSEKVEFQFADVESAKNAWRFCVLQHTFYRQYEMNNDQTDKGPLVPPVFQQAQIEVSLRIISKNCMWCKCM